MRIKKLKRHLHVTAVSLFFLACNAMALDPSAPAAQMREIKPVIAPPPKPVHDVRNYGAVGDGKTYDTEALQKAIDACAGTGGSVLLSKGTFLTALLKLKGKMTLYIAPDAVLLGGTKPDDYPEISPMEPAGTSAIFFRRGLLFADQADKLVIDGGGAIDGQGKLVQMNGKEPDRPSILRIFHSKDVAVRNVTLRNSRMWTQVYDHCVGLTIENVKVSCPPIVGNHDGLDICDCENVVVRNCNIESEDDGICLKSHGPTGLKNILVENNTILCYGANGIKLGTGTSGPIENLRILNNTVKYAKFGGLCIESVDGAAVSNVTVRGLDIYKASQPIFVRLGRRNPKGRIGSITDVTIEQVRILGTHGRTTPSNTITGVPDAKLGNILLKDIYVEMPGGMDKIPGEPPEKDGYPQSNIFGNPPAYGFFVRHADDVKFENMTIGCVKPDARPWLASSDAAVKTVECTEVKQMKEQKIPK